MNEFDLNRVTMAKEEKRGESKGSIKIGRRAYQIYQILIDCLIIFVEILGII